jgi:hypothetical protein
LFCWSLKLGIRFLHFPLNPVLNYFGGRMVSILFSSSTAPLGAVSVPGLCAI